MIPIQNIYYMLSYAFQVLQEQGYRQVSILPTSVQQFWNGALPDSSSEGWAESTCPKQNYCRLCGAKLNLPNPSRCRRPASNG